MARRKGRRRKKRGFTIPLAPIAGLVPMVLPSIQMAIAGDLNSAGTHLVWNTIGVDGNGNFNMGKLVQNVTPVIAGLLIHKFVGGAPLHLNRILANAGVPFIRI